MYFTREDYLKIEEWLKQNAIKDTEFKDAELPVKEQDTITLVQDGKNVKVSLKDFIDQLFNLGVSDFLNITDKYKQRNITIEQAISLIPSRARKKGQVITFLNSDSKWVLYQFKGELNQWNIVDLWDNIFDINKYIINSIIPDEEDLTMSLPDSNGNSYISLKDREYNPQEFSGKGRIILRKNIAEEYSAEFGKVKKNILVQDMINQPNTIYEIRYDFDLNGQEITIPEGCVLQFEGGSLSNGSINGNNTYINSKLYKIFYNINFKGNYNNIFQIKWFVKNTSKDINNLIDSSNEIQQAFNCGITEIFFTNAIYYIPKTIIINNNVNIYGDMVYNLIIHEERLQEIKAGIYTDKGNTIFKYIDNLNYEKSLNIQGLNIISNYNKINLDSYDKNIPIIDLNLNSIWNLNINLNINEINNSKRVGVGLNITTSTYISFININGNLDNLYNNIKINTISDGWINDITHNGNCAGVKGIIINGKSNILRLNGKYQTRGYYNIPNNNESFIDINKCTTIINTLIWDLGIGNKYAGYTSQYAIDGNNTEVICNYPPLIPFIKNYNGVLNRNYNNLDNINDSCITDYAFKENVSINIKLKNNENVLDFTYKDLYKFFDTNSISEKDCFFITCNSIINQDDLNNINLEITIKDNNKNTLAINGNFFYLYSPKVSTTWINSFKEVDILIQSINGTTLLERNNIYLEQNSNDYNYQRFIYSFVYLSSYSEYTIKLKYKKLKSIDKKITIGNIGINGYKKIDSIVNGGTIDGIVKFNNALITKDRKKIIPFNRNSGSIGFYSEQDLYLGTVSIKKSLTDILFIYGTITIMQPSEKQLEEYSISDVLIMVNVTENSINCYGESNLSEPIELYYIKDENDINNNTIDIFFKFYFYSYIVNINFTSIYSRYTNIIFNKIHTDNYIKEGNKIICGNLSNVISSNNLPIKPASGKYVFFKDLKCAATYVNRHLGWRTFDGVKINAKRTGIFSEKPTTNEGIFIGFAYFCTDKQTTEGQANGIMIYHKGNNVWVDALGRIVS